MIKRYYLYNENGLCTRSIYFMNDSTYSYEGGCEASSHFHLGHWTCHKDTITFTPDTAVKFDPVKRMVARHIISDSVVVKVFDAEGNNISDRFNVGYRVPRLGVYASDYDWQHQYRRVHIRGGGAVVLFPLELTFRRSFVLNTDTANYFEVTVAMPANISAHGSVPFYSSPFQLLFKGDSMVSFGQDFVNTTIFKRIKP